MDKKPLSHWQACAWLLHQRPCPASRRLFAILEDATSSNSRMTSWLSCCRHQYCSAVFCVHDGLQRKAAALSSLCRTNPVGAVVNVQGPSNRLRWARSPLYRSGCLQRNTRRRDASIYSVFRDIFQIYALLHRSKRIVSKMFARIL